MAEIKVRNKVYTQSRGFSNQHGYDWQCNDESQFSDPPYINIPGLKQAELNSFCLILSRSNDKLFLLASGLPSERKDIRHREIRNTVMWSIENPSDGDEAIFRSLAALLLRHCYGDSTINDRIKEAITGSKDNNYGYSANFNLLGPEELIKKNIGNNVLESRLLKLKPDTLDYSDENLKKLAKEIEESSLPIQTKNLIVVTDNRTQVIVDKDILYFGLGNITIYQSTPKSQESENDLLIEVEKFIGYIKDTLTNNINPKFLLFAIIGLIGTGGALSLNLGSNQQSVPIPHLKSLEISIPFNQDRPSQFNYTLTGSYNSSPNFPTIEKVKLIDINSKEIATGKLDTSMNWRIAYKLESKINCHSQLSIQGFSRDDKEIGKSTILPPLCSVS